VVRKIDLMSAASSGSIAARRRARAGAGGALFEGTAHSIGLYQALPGHIFGETLLRTPKEEKQSASGPPKWPYSVVATLPTQIYIISKAEFIRFLGGTPTAKALRVMASEQRGQMMRRLERMQRRIAECHELVHKVVPLSSTTVSVGTATRAVQAQADKDVLEGRTGPITTVSGAPSAGATPTSSGSGGGGSGGGGGGHHTADGGMGGGGSGGSDSRGSAEAVALANLTRGYRVDMCIEQRRQLTAMAAQYLEGGRFDARRVQLTKHLTPNEAARLNRAKQSVLHPDREAPPPRGTRAGGSVGRGGAGDRLAAKLNKVHSNDSFSYSMAVNYNTRVMEAD